MKAMVSGASGFIGSRLCQELLSKEYQVVRIKQELLYSPADLREFIEEEQPDYIYHLAAYGNMAQHSDVSMIVFSNIIGTFNLLKESLRVPYKAFINFGSSSEYGKKDSAMNERDALEPQTFYGASKASATLLAKAFAVQHEKPIITVRPFSVYGPGEAPFRFIPTIIRNMISKKTFPLDEKAVHDWIYIDDFIAGLFTAQQNLTKISEKVVNIGSGRMHTNKEICIMLKKIVGVPYLATPFEGMRKHDSHTWLADTSSLNRFGWYPKYMLQEGLLKTYEYYKTK